MGKQEERIELEREAGIVRIAEHRRISFTINQPFEESELLRNLLKEILNTSEVFEWTVSHSQITAESKNYKNREQARLQWFKEILKAYSKVKAIQKDINKPVRE